MGLVEYSDSETDPERPATSPPAKKRRIAKADDKALLPPLPAAFLDQYSSTVRTSTQDDPSLHGGRKRATPHVQGNWPTHVYLEWHPDPAEYDLLSALIEHTGEGADTFSRDSSDIHSLLRNELGVPLPLHISLSRPLTLKTAEKEGYLDHVKKALQDHSAGSVRLSPKDLIWHPNESSTRWFLVISMQTSRDLSQLLQICNSVSKEFQQPLLYAEGNDDKIHDHFHISIAWSLVPPIAKSSSASGVLSPVLASSDLPDEHSKDLLNLQIDISEVKVRIGQDVNVLRLKTRR